MSTLAGNLDSSDLLEELQITLEQRADEWPLRVEGYEKSRALMDRFVDHVFREAERPGSISDGACTGSSDDWQRLLYQNPIVIGGPMKSGTTLFCNLLDGHPELLVLPGDSRLMKRRDQFNRMDFEEFARYWLCRFINPTGQRPFWCFCNSAERSAEDYAQILRDMLHFKRAERENIKSLIYALGLSHLRIHHAVPRCWVEKTPGNEFSHENILSLFPSARFIYVFRDPVDNFFSVKRLDRVRRWNKSSLHWARYIGSGLKTLKNCAQSPGADVRLVRYETLLENTDEALKRICQFLGIAWQQSLMIPTVSGRDSTANSMVPSEVQAQGLMPVRRRTSEVSLPERWIIKALTGRVHADLIRMSE